MTKDLLNVALVATPGPPTSGNFKQFRRKPVVALSVGLDM